MMFHWNLPPVCFLLVNLYDLTLLTFPLLTLISLCPCFNLQHPLFSMMYRLTVERHMGRGGTTSAYLYVSSLLHARMTARVDGSVMLSEN